MPCECQSGVRTLVLFGDLLSDAACDLLDFELGDAWQPLPHARAIRVTLEPGGAWPSLHDVLNFLRAVVTQDDLAGLHMGWLPGCGSADPETDLIGRLDGVFRAVDAMPAGDSALLDVLIHRRIETWFQPVFTADDGELWGHECLARARDQAGELIPPIDLFSDARRERLTFMLDRICRETHIESAGRHGLGNDTHVLINFVPTAIYNPAYCLRTTERAVERCGLDRNKVIFEVVESEKIDDREHLNNLLAHYRRHGYGVALDDVGAGYAGLTMLAEMMPDLVKIDRALVVGAARSRSHRSICAALIQIAHDCGKLALAEGIETDAQWRAMTDLGVDLLQGFRFGRPCAIPQREPADAAAA